MRILPLTLLLLVTACGGSRPAPTQYGLNATAPDVGACRAASIKLYEPVAGAGLASSRIVVRQEGGTESFYEGVRWNANTTRMLQLYLADAFEQSGMFRTVLTDDATGRTGWILETQLRGFHVEQAGARSQLVIRLSATLVQSASRVPVKTVPLEARRDVTGLTMQQIVRVFEGEMAALTTQLLYTLRPQLGCA